MPRLNQLTDVEKFIHPEPNSGCWLWTGTHTQKDNGYGQFWIQGKMMVAHRASYILYKGPIPDGLTLDHKCRVRMCVNPNHLEPVTAQVNVLRGIGFAATNSRKTHCIHGHEFTPANTKVRSDGRECIACIKERLLSKKLLRKAGKQHDAETDN